MDDNARPYIIAVYGGKGGIGKTTLSQLIAWQFADHGDTLLVDADEQGSGAKIYGALKVTAPYTITAEHDPNALRHLPDVPYRYVVVDLPPSRREARAGLETADLVLVPFVPRWIDTAAIITTLRDVLDGIPHALVMSRVTRSRRSAERATRAMFSAHGTPVLTTVMREYEAPHERALNVGIPIVHPDATGANTDKAAADARDLFAEILSVAQAVAA